MLLLRINHLSKALMIRRLPVDLLAPLCHISSYLTFSSNNNNNDSNNINGNKTDSSNKQLRIADHVTAVEIDTETFSRAIYTLYAVLTLCPIVPTFIQTLLDLGIPRACYILHLACITDQLTSPPTSSSAPAKVALVDDHAAAASSDGPVLEVLAQLETICFLFMKHLPVELSVTCLYERLTGRGAALAVSRKEHGLVLMLSSSYPSTSTASTFPVDTTSDSLLLPSQQTSSRITPVLSLALTSPSSLLAAKHSSTDDGSSVALVEDGVGEGDSDAYADIVAMLGGLASGRDGASTGSDHTEGLREAYNKTRTISILVQSYEAYIHTISSDHVPTTPSPSPAPTPEASQLSESLGIASKLFMSCLSTYFKVPSASSTSSTHLPSGRADESDAVDKVQVCGIAMVVLQQEMPLSSLLYDGKILAVTSFACHNNSITILCIIYIYVQVRAYCGWCM